MYLLYDSFTDQSCINHYLYNNLDNANNKARSVMKGYKNIFDGVHKGVDVDGCIDYHDDGCCNYYCYVVKIEVDD